MRKLTTLDRLGKGQKAVVRNVSADDDIKRRFLDMGLVKDTVVECVLISPMGDPLAFIVRGALIAFRCDDISEIEVEII